MKTGVRVAYLRADLRKMLQNMAVDDTEFDFARFCFLSIDLLSWQVTNKMHVRRVDKAYIV